MQFIMFVRGRREQRLQEKIRKYELAADEIVVFEVYDHELKITLKDGEKILSGSLHTYEEKLEEYGFIKYRAQLCSIQDI